MKRRRLTRNERLQIFEDSGGVCHICEQQINAGEPWEADHPEPLWMGGDDSPEALRPAHIHCHKRKTADDKKRIAKTKRIRQKHLGIGKIQSRPMPGTKASGWRKRMNGDVERR